MNRNVIESLSRAGRVGAAVAFSAAAVLPGCSGRTIETPQGPTAAAEQINQKTTFAYWSSMTFDEKEKKLEELKGKKIEIDLEADIIEGAAAYSYLPNDRGYNYTVWSPRDSKAKSGLEILASDNPDDFSKDPWELNTSRMRKNRVFKAGSRFIVEVIDNPDTNDHNNFKTPIPVFRDIIEVK